MLPAAVRAAHLASGTYPGTLVDCDQLVSAETVHPLALRLDLAMLLDAGARDAYRAIWGQDFEPASGIADLDVIRAILAQCDRSDRAATATRA